MVRKDNPILIKWINTVKEALFWGQWGHWVSLKGLKLIFDVPDDEIFIFAKALSKLKLEKRFNTINGSFYPCANCGGTFVYTPCFKKEYWEKIVEVKKQVPIVKTTFTKHNTWENLHTYEMLLHVPIIPTYQDLVDNEGNFNACFDVEFYKNNVIDRDKFEEEYKKLRRKNKKKR